MFQDLYPIIYDHSGETGIEYLTGTPSYLRCYKGFVDYEDFGEGSKFSSFVRSCDDTRSTGVIDIRSDDNAVFSHYDKGVGVLHIRVKAQGHYSVSLYDLSGVKVAEAMSDGEGSVSLPMSAVAGAVYLLEYARIGAKDTRLTTKITI